MVAKAIRNSRSPDVVAKEIIAHHRTSVSSTIAICQLFAEGWQNYENGAWNNGEISKFLTSIHNSGIGSDPTNTILKEAIDGRFKIKSNAGSFSFMKSVGEHPVFQNEEVLDVCRVTGYSVLYAVTLFYNAVADGYKDPDVGMRRATGQTIKLFGKGSELTREDVYTARDGIVTAQSRAPKSKVPNILPSKSTTYQTLSSSREQFGHLFITPPANVLMEIENSSYETLLENYSYMDVREPDSDLSILVDGSHLSTAIKLANAMSCVNPKVYCVTNTDKNDRIINISNEKILVTSKEISPPKKISKNTDLNDLVRTSVHSPKVANLHLFADDAVDGWTTCVGVDASTA